MDLKDAIPRRLTRNWLIGLIFGGFLVVGADGHIQRVAAKEASKVKRALRAREAVWCEQQRVILTKLEGIDHAVNPNHEHADPAPCPPIKDDDGE